MILPALQQEKKGVTRPPSGARGRDYRVHAQHRNNPMPGYPECPARAPVRTTRDTGRVTCGECKGVLASHPPGGGRPVEAMPRRKAWNRRPVQMIGKAF